ncbi:unnamed protein product [Clonostachys rosea]|uniref:N-acetyltransferase domain-containing protein n=1 Tax=Bionectria ochroleuca TaxID=29856 RepID=A0ABY6UFF0_BIOOC|nr:unnamed protein product [Clonostachys rosea]
MKSFRSSVQGKTWQKDNYLISTDHTSIPVADLINAFASDEFYWANAISTDAMKETLENSLCFGVYDIAVPTSKESGNHAPKFIGIARCVTDFVTFVYVTDVWVDSGYQGQGLGSWLVKCIQETIEPMPYLRRSILFTGDWERSVPFYEKLMDMKVMNEPQRGQALALMERKGRGHPSYGREGGGYN